MDIADAPPADSGATGREKRVHQLHHMSILYKSAPDESSFFDDPKVVELGVYNGIPIC